MEEYKTCSKCKQQFPKSNFGKNKKAKDGLRSQCKPCRNEGARADYKKRADYWPAYRAKNAAKLKQYRKDYKLKNKDLLSRKYQIYRQNNLESTKARLRRHRENNKNLYRHYSHQRRVLKESKYLITKAELNALLQKNCIYCNNKAQHIDHILPLSRGGEHRIGNLAPACQSCNLSKGNKFVMEWKRKIRA